MKFSILVCALVLLGGSAHAAKEIGESIGTRGGGAYQPAMLKAEALQVYRKALLAGSKDIEGVSLEALVSTLDQAKVSVSSEPLYWRMSQVPSLGDRANKTIFVYINKLDQSWEPEQKVWDITHGVLDLLSVNDAGRMKSHQIMRSLFALNDVSARNLESVFEINFPYEALRLCAIADKTKIVRAFQSKPAEMEKSLRAAMDHLQQTTGGCVRLEMSDFPRGFFADEASVRAFSVLYIDLVLPHEIVAELRPWLRVKDIGLKLRLLEKIVRAGVSASDRESLYDIARVGLDEYEANLPLRPGYGLASAKYVAVAAAWAIAQSGTNEGELKEKAYRVFKALDFAEEMAEPLALMKIGDPEKLIEVARRVRASLDARGGAIGFGWERLLRFLGASEPRDPRVLEEYQALIADLRTKFSAAAVANLRIDWVESFAPAKASLAVLARCFDMGDRQYEKSFVIAGDLAQFQKTGRVKGIYAKESLSGPYPLLTEKAANELSQRMDLMLTRQGPSAVRLTGTFTYLTLMLPLRVVDSFDGTSQGLTLEVGVRTAKETVEHPGRLSQPEPSGVMRCQLSPEMLK